MKSKYLLVLLLSLFMVVALTACKNRSGSEANLNSDNMQEKNSINSHCLSNDEEVIVKLLNNDDTTGIFDYLVDESFTSFEVWWEEYENGKLVKVSDVLSSDISKRDGKISITIHQKDVRISLMKNVNSKDIKWFGDSINVTLEGASGSSISTQTQIIKDTEIPLLVFCVNNTDEELKEPQFYIDNPNSIENFKNLVLFKCRFN